jgi:hypothetical protein
VVSGAPVFMRMFSTCHSVPCCAAKSGLPDFAELTRGQKPATVAFHGGEEEASVHLIET